MNLNTIDNNHLTYYDNYDNNQSIELLSPIKKNFQSQNHIINNQEYFQYNNISVDINQKYFESFI